MERPAFHDAARAWTHAEVHDGGHRAAAFLLGSGVRPGDRVLLVARDRVELVWALLGAARVGATAVLVNPLLPELDHDFMLRDSSPTLVVCEPLLRERFAATAPTLVVDDLSEMEPGTFPGPEVDLDTPAYAQYTSGTTGMPRAALHRHTDPACYYRAMGAPVLMLQPEDVVLSVSKAYFAYGLGNTVFFPLFSGCSAVLDADKPTVDRVESLTTRHGVTVLFAVPSFYAGLVSRGDARCFASVRLAISAGEALQPTLYHRARSWLGREIVDGLGSTEVGQTFISNTPGRSRPASIGSVLPGYEALVCDESGRALPPEQSGALWVRGDSVMIGYLNRPDATAAAVVDGWCRTGDRVSADRDGYFYHHGRLDDIEVVGGNNVSPLEVEAVLLEHPAVVEVAVAAVLDQTGASRLQGFAVVNADVGAPLDLESQLLALARARLAPFKVPRSVTVVDALPRTATGKLRRHVLRAGWPDPK
ncbi:MAG: AMP-binding protein [Actinomycetota bacterium]|nr:AMP-binding protein [Actinomycetota bacterium]